MKVKFVLLISLLTLTLSGCSKINDITEERYLDFQEQVLMDFDFLENCHMYFWYGPNDLYVEYEVSEKPDVKLVQACYEETKEFLLAPGNLDLLGIENDNYYGIRGIFIVFKKDHFDIQYASNYYKNSPSGIQDNLYWTEENVDGFSTWTIYEHE